MIANTFIKRPVTAIVISIVLLLVGSISILNLAIGQYPEITPPQVQVTGQFTGADALTVEQTMATPVENTDKWLARHGVPAEQLYKQWRACL